jgi:hypothetical protein
VSAAVVSSAPGGAQDSRPAGPAPRKLPFTPAGMVIAAAAVGALGLRVYQLMRPDMLLGVAWYDDGVFFASALRLVDGVLPYRDFYFVQPPGLTLLLAPAALLAKLAGTSWGMAAGRILTLLASTACVVLGGLLVRHRGLLAVIVTSGLLAVYPASVTDARTIVVESWLTLFCLAGALAVFDGDQLAGGARLVWGGVTFGFAGAVESWAILPVLVVLVLCLPNRKTAASFAAGVAAGFLVPVLPFAVLAPRQLYQSVVIGALVRYREPRVPDWIRVQDMIGLTHLRHPGHLILLVAALALIGFVAAAAAAASLIAHRPPPPLEWFGVATAALVAAAFMWPPEFFSHFPAFLAPFLALAIALPASRLLTVSPPFPRRAWAGRWPRRAAAGLAGLVLASFAVIQAGSETTLAPRVGPRAVAAARHAIPPGACVLTDQVSFTIAANRFFSTVPGCPQMIDPLVTDYALSPGRDGLNGAGRVPAVAAVMRNAFDHAQYVWLSGTYNRRRIAWTPALRAYFRRDFVRVLTDHHGDALYRRKGLHLS